VRLKNCRSCSIDYRNGYSTLPRDVEITRALRTPLSASLQGASLPVTATTGAIAFGRDGSTLPIEARVPFKELQFVPVDKGWQAQVEIYVSIFDEGGRNLALQRYIATATAPAATAAGDLIQDATLTIPAGKPHTIVIAVRDEASDALGVWQQTLAF